MGYERLFLADLQDSHLTELQRVVRFGINANIESWLEDIADGDLEVYDLETGLLGIRQRDSRIYIEFLVGRKVVHRALAWLKEIAEGRTLDFVTTKPSLVRLYRQIGFVPVAVCMRMTP